MARGARAWAAACLALWPALGFACPSCADALARDPDGLHFARGIYYSIVVLFAVLGTLVFLVVRAIVKEARRDPHAGPGGGTA